MKSIKVTHISDPGHGWIEVPLETLAHLKIVEDMSGFSYIKGAYAYLEEDCDAGKFIQTCKAHGIECKIDYTSDNSGRYSAIRNYERYSHNAAYAALNGE